jgi:hypothetical protein
MQKDRHVHFRAANSATCLASDAGISSAERKSVTVYWGSVNRGAGATFGVGENSAVFPIEVILYPSEEHRHIDVC